MSAPAAGERGGGVGGRPDNVGILAADVYFPSTFVAQVYLCLCIMPAIGSGLTSSLPVLTSTFTVKNGNGMEAVVRTKLDR